jgi:hypothetical protein
MSSVSGSRPCVTRIQSGNTLGMGVFAAVVVLMGISLTGCGNNLAKSAKPIVTSILAKQMGGRAECVEVKLGKEFAEDRYHATAVLSNGNELKIVIHDKGNEVEVTIPTQQ